MSFLKKMTDKDQFSPAFHINVNSMIFVDLIILGKMIGICSFIVE